MSINNEIYQSLSEKQNLMKKVKELEDKAKSIGDIISVSYGNFPKTFYFINKERCEKINESVRIEYLIKYFFAYFTPTDFSAIERAKLLCSFLNNLDGLYLIPSDLVDENCVNYECNEHNNDNDSKYYHVHVIAAMKYLEIAFGENCVCDFYSTLAASDEKYKDFNSSLDLFRFIKESNFNKKY